MGLSVWRETSKTEVNCVSWKKEKINRVSWIIFVQIIVLFDYLMYLVYLVFLVWRKIKRAPWNREIFNLVPCLPDPYWDPPEIIFWEWGGWG